MTIVTNTILIDNSPPATPGQPQPPNAIPSKDPADPTALKYARIGWQNVLTSAANTEQAKALTANTYERWTDNSGAASGVFGCSATSIDFIGIAAHNLFSSGATGISVSYATTQGGPYTKIQDITPASDGAIALLLTNAIANVVEIKLDVTSVGTGIEIGVVHAGAALVMTQPIYGGHSPIVLSANTDYQTAQSDTGQFLGRTITRKGLESQFQWQRLDPDWYRATFQPFVNAAKTKPFFISWRPDYFGAETAYCHTTRDIRPTNQGGGHKLMSVSMSVRGHADT